MTREQRIELRRITEFAGVRILTLFNPLCALNPQSTAQALGHYMNMKLIRPEIEELLPDGII